MPKLWNGAGQSGLLRYSSRWLIRWIVGRYLRGPQTFYLFENADDPAEFGLAATGCRVTLVGGREWIRASSSSPRSRRRRRSR